MNRLIVILLCGLTTGAVAAPQERKFVSDRAIEENDPAGKGDKAKTTKEKKAAEQAKRQQKLRKSDRVTGLSERQQKNAIEFAQKNHPELLPLLKQLKSKDRRVDYQRAIRDLHNANTRFGRLKERLSTERYESQLLIWKLDSRIRLQLAKWSMSKDDKLETDIRSALTERQALQRRQLEEELQRLNERRSRIEKLLGGLSSDSVTAEWERLAKSVTRGNRQNKKAAQKKAAAKKGTGSQKKPDADADVKKQPRKNRNSNPKKRDNSKQSDK